MMTLLRHVSSLISVAADLLGDYEQESQGYGFCPSGMDPRLFCPDGETTTPEEMAAHKADCERMEHGEEPVTKRGRETTTDGATSISIQYSGYGMGMYTMADQRLVDAGQKLRDIHRVLATMKREEKEAREARRAERDGPEEGGP